MPNRKVKYIPLSHEYVDCLEQSFRPRVSPSAEAGPGAASGGTAPAGGGSCLRGTMGNTPLANSSLGRISEDTVHLSVWVDWGTEIETLFERFRSSQEEAQRKDLGPAMASTAEGDTGMDVMYGALDFFESATSIAPGNDYFIEGQGSGYMEFGGELWKMLPRGVGGRDGRAHYSYALVMGGIMLAFRREKHETVSNLWVEVGSIPLAMHGGLAGVWKKLQGMLKAEGIVILKDIVSRVDMYADFPDVGVDEFCGRFFENRRVTRARKVAHYGEELNTALYLSGRRYTGFSIGQNIRLRCYDKRLELEKDPIKRGVFAEKYDGIPEVLTRVEFQLRRVALKEFARFVLSGDTNLPHIERIDSVSDYLEKREMVWRYLTESWFRLTEGEVDSKNNNQSRSKTWGVWERVQSAAIAAGGSVRRVTRRVRVDSALMKKMGLGCFVKAAIVELGPQFDGARDLVRYFRDAIVSLGRDYFDGVVEKHWESKFLRAGFMLEGV